MVRAGDTLAIPGTERSESVAASSSAPLPVAAATNAAVVSAPKQGAYEHVVAPGESLTVIAQKYDVKIGAIALANKMARTIWAMLTKQEDYRDPALATTV